MGWFQTELKELKETHNLTEKYMSIFKQYCSDHNIVFHKSENLHILSTLVWNWVMRVKLRLYKFLHGIHRPIVHYYAVCWDEEKMLPFMFQHYDRFVDHYTIYDNFSDDNSEGIIRSHKNAEIIKFKTEGFDDTTHNDIKNNCWKRSRGKADYVIVCDIDEFLYNPDLQKLLGNKISLPVTEGYNMYSETFPADGKDITFQIRKGIADSAYNKCLIFDPHRIVEINYLPGAHQAKPVGIVTRGEEKAKVLHYKNLGLDYILERYHILAKRLSEKNKEQNLGTHYLYPDEKISADFIQGLTNSTPVI